ncbi:MAG: hypothetical protein IPK84_01545 [Candidatus Moraniibacteriota bacterium]|nr:MAG: hypothetical protein IPK84_01545 [Candidatus Moranbacteria bacterium]
MLIFWKQFREVIVLLGMAGFLAALVYFGIVRIMGNNHEKMESIQKAIVDRKMLEEQSQGIAGMRDTWEHIQASDGKLDVFLPKSRIVSLVESLEAIGKDLNVTVVSEASEAPRTAPSATKKIVTERNTSKGDEATAATPTEEGSDDKALSLLLPADRSIFVTFKVTGTYDHVLAFLQKLDTMPTLLDVLSFDISPVPVKDEAARSVPASSVPRVSLNPFSNSTVVAGELPDASADSPENATDVTASFLTVIYTAP